MTAAAEALQAAFEGKRDFDAFARSRMNRSVYTKEVEGDKTIEEALAVPIHAYALRKQNIFLSAKKLLEAKRPK